MSLKKPSQLFQEEKVFIAEDYSPVVETFNETFDKFRGNLSIVEDLNEKVNYLAEEIGNKITKNDLETALFSHLLMVDESIKSIDAKVKGLNKNDLLEFKRTSSHLEELVEDLSKNQFPKYKKKIVDTEVKISEKFNLFKEEVIQNQETAENELQEKLNNFAEVVDHNFTIFNHSIQETKEYANETVETYRKLFKVLENKTEKENERLDEYSNVLDKFNTEFITFQQNIQEQIQNYEKINSIFDSKFKSFKNNLDEWKSDTQNHLKTFKGKIDNNIVEFKEDLTSLKADIVVYENHNKSLNGKVDSLQKNFSRIDEIKTLRTDQLKFKEDLTETQKNLEIVERYIQNHHNDIIELKEEVFNEIEKLPFGNLEENIHKLNQKLNYIEEVYKNIEPEVIIKEVIKEGLAEPSSINSEDPLTPLNQNFVTLDQLQQHYRLFLNRIQQQLATLGGGGETQLKYLDDIVGIATNASFYDGKYLKYNHSLRKFEFDSVDITNDSWDNGVNGPYTNGSVGINTSIANCELDIVGNVCVTGIITAGGFDGGPLSGSSGSFTQISVSGVGTITTLDTTSGTIDFLSGINISASNFVTANTFNVGTDAGISTTRTTVATLSATTIDSFAIATYRSARVQVQITQGTDYQTSDVLIIHDGSTASVIEYASIATDDYLGTFSGLVSGGNCLLQINMNSASSATVKVLSQRITV